jgi:bifunctional non-homologous end joining protein LigD
MKTRDQLTVDGRNVPVSNLDKILYPTGRFTKAQVIDYYIRVAGFLLPHLKDRPVTLKRYPGGVRGKFFTKRTRRNTRPSG